MFLGAFGGRRSHATFFFWDMTTSRTGRGREHTDYHDDLFVDDGDLGEMRYADIAKLSYPSRSCFEAAGRAVFRWRGRRQVCFDITCHPCSVSRTLLGPLLASRHNLGEEGFGNLCACAHQKKENQGPNLFGRRRGKGGWTVVTLQERQEVPRCWLLQKELGIEAWTPGRWASSSTDVHRYEVGIADKGEPA